jgi:phosphate starvation-inducible protein PhoH and related proteins
MVITGDVTQVDLPNGAKSGLRIIRDILATSMTSHLVN